MARKQKTVVIEHDGRDKDKVFIITEMSAWNAELWALRLFLALAKSGVDLPPNIREMGLQGVAVLGLRAIQGLQFTEAEALLNEMMTCVRVLPDVRNNPDFERSLIVEDVEEVRTIWLLRREVFELHVGFSLADAEQMWALAETTTEAL